MPPAALTATHEFLGLAGSAQPPNAAFLNSLTGDAALRIANDHVLNSWLSGLAPQGAGFKRFTYRQFYYVFNVKECQPWEHVERVATSRSVGEGCAQPEWYQKAVWMVNVLTTV